MSDTTERAVIRVGWPRVELQRMHHSKQCLSAGRARLAAAQPCR
ncbi:hypothetical protein PD5205_03433 [Xanthomonas fragariae]|uniref:Uncharacterized protein n=1 Tax=Xanthomonas fragariae TaxID=48664 RepID=A0A1Y6HMI1_9XANT|nr:hypothetical protein PD885_00558 [Xanthomonas fragariae]SMR04709.1 hypothetical protein PD5205_03433 [Xanthomonas fragariae]